jgi:dynein heavy chain
MYDELPRTSWIFKYSAQNTVAVSRTFFTQEVNEAFDELEEGNEEALKNEYERQVHVSILLCRAVTLAGLLK